MLQDIYPRKIDNQYKNIKPEEDSICIAFNNNAILTNEGEHIIYPKYGEIKYEIAGYVYLFSIDTVKYFMVDLNCDEILGYEFVPMRKFRSKKPKVEVFAGMTAYHLYVWYRDNKYCGRCGHVLEHSEDERMLHCDKCNNSVYPKIMPAVIVGVTNGDKILVTRYKNSQYKGYALIAGFTEIGETAEETVAREVKEEAGINVKNIRYYKTQPWGIAQDLLLGYFCEVDGDDIITIDEDELAVAEWVSRDELEIHYEDISMTNEMIWKFKNNEYGK